MTVLDDDLLPRAPMHEPVSRRPVRIVRIEMTIETAPTT